MKEEYIDLHCHLDLCEDLPGLVERAKAAGVTTMLAQGVNAASNKKVLEMAQQYPEIKASLGLYPIDALPLSDEQIDAIIQHIRDNKDQVVAIGEVGIDYKEDSTQHERQHAIFQKMIDLSLELDIPIIVHSRKAEEQCIEMLEKSGAKKVIMHCFCGKQKLVQRIAQNGWYLTIPTNVKHSQQFQITAKEIVLTQLFCETDSPYLHPDKLSNNEPANIIESYKMIAALKGLPLDDIKERIAKNYSKLFTKN